MSNPNINQNAASNQNSSGTGSRIAILLLTLSAAGFSAWQVSEGDGPTAKRPDGVVVHMPYVPTKGDVPTIGNGSTRYEDGTPVRMTDKPITRERATLLARKLNDQEEVKFRASLPGAKLHQEEFDLYIDFVGQYGIGNWRTSSMRREILAGNYAKACQSLLAWRFQDGRDCKLQQNWGPKGCKGVWTRQVERNKKCVAAQ